MTPHILEYKGQQFPYHIEELGDFIADGNERIRISSEQVGLNAEFLKEDMDDALAFLKLYINRSLKEDCVSFEQLKIWSRKYKVAIHRLGKKADWKVRVRIVCKGAKYNQEHPEEQLESIINQKIPEILKQGQAEKKTSPFQIRFTPLQREKLEQLAQKNGITLSDLIIQKVFA